MDTSDTGDPKAICLKQARERYCEAFELMRTMFVYSNKKRGRKESMSNRSKHSIAFQHELANYLDQPIRKTVGVAQKIHTGNNSVVVTFEEPFA